MKKEPIIHLVPTFHHDIAYLKPEADYTAMATEIVDKAVSFLRKDPTYTYTVEQAYFFKEYWETHPELQEELCGYVQQGRLTFAPGFWSVPDMCMPSGESIFQNATYGRRLLHDLTQAAPRTAFIADCWGHHAQLPQIISQCGYDYYLFSRCMDPDFAQENFRWQGLDGTVLKTHWASSSYAGISFPDEGPVVNAEELHWEEAGADGLMNIYNTNKSHGSDGAQIVPVGGDMKLPADSSLNIVPELQKNETLPYPAFSSLDAGLDAVDFENAPLYDGEFISALKGTFSTNIRIKQYNRKMEQELYALEVLSVLKNKPTELSDEWALTLKNQFHDILCGTICDEAVDQAYREYDAALASLEQKRTALSKNGEPALFNALPFAVKELRGNTLCSAEGFGYAQEVELMAQSGAVPAVFENEWYRAELDAMGFITKLTELQGGKTVFTKQEIPFGSLLMEADGGDNWVEFEYPWELNASHFTTNTPDPYDRSAQPVHPKVALSKVGVRRAEAKLLSDGSICITQQGSLDYWATHLPFTTTVTLSKTSPRIDYHTEFDVLTKRIRLRVAFPTELQGGSVRHQIPYGMVDRGEGTQPPEYFMDQQKDGAGLALINRGLPANNTEDGIMMLTLFRGVAMEYKCASVLSYNLGEHICCDYAVIPHAAGSDAMLWEQALHFQRPLLETTREELLPFGIKGAMISALRHDNGAVFARIYNNTEQTCEAKITLPAEITAYQLTDGCMQPVGEPISVSGSLTLPLNPFQIQGIKFYQ